MTKQDYKPITIFTGSICRLRFEGMMPVLWYRPIITPRGMFLSTIGIN